MNSLLQTFALAFILILLLPSSVDKHLNRPKHNPYPEEVASHNYYSGDWSISDENANKIRQQDTNSQSWFPTYDSLSNFSTGTNFLNNFLIEKAEKIQSLGTKSLKIFISQ
ncbi:MAG: hypothetical protein AAFR87_32045 [Bacteroidota bacterium]